LGSTTLFVVNNSSVSLTRRVAKWVYFDREAAHGSH
jgi:hypothetical protein